MVYKWNFVTRLWWLRQYVDWLRVPWYEHTLYEKNALNVFADEQCAQQKVDSEISNNFKPYAYVYTSYLKVLQDDNLRPNRLSVCTPKF